MSLADTVIQMREIIRAGETRHTPLGVLRFGDNGRCALGPAYDWPGQVLWLVEQEANLVAFVMEHCRPANNIFSVLGQWQGTKNFIKDALVFNVVLAKNRAEFSGRFFCVQVYKDRAEVSAIKKPCEVLEERPL